MKGTQLRWLIIGGGILLVVGLYSLPKVVVSQKGADATVSAENSVRDSTAAQATGETHEESGTDAHEEHKAEESVHGKTEISGKGKTVLTTLQSQWNEKLPSTEKIKLAKQIASTWDQEGKLDSAAQWFIKAARLENTEAGWEKAADKSLDAATLSEGEAKSKKLAEARSFYEKAMTLSKTPNNVKAKLAMTWVETENPMQAIAILREVVAAEPENEQALYNLGVLSVQSRQFERAVGRFEKVVTLNPKNLKAWFYLALSYKETGKKEEAIKAFQHLQKMDQDPVVQSTVKDYLKELGASQ